MAGTIFGLGLSQQIDGDGKPLAGARLYIMGAGTSAPVDVFKEYALTNLHPHPIELDSLGRVPQIWLADGTYRARLIDKSGVVIFDEDGVTALGPSSGSGGGDTTDPNATLTTGDMKWRPSTGTLSGWVRSNGRTIGSAVSGATERANADCEALFLHLWASFSDTLCPVTTGRGAAAAADWAANKQITLVDMRGRAPFGVADMGNADSGRLSATTFSAGNKTTGGSPAGADSVTLTVAQMPSHTHTQTAHSHNIKNRNRNDMPSTGSNDVVTEIGAGTLNDTTDSTTAVNQNTGGGAAHPNMPPGVVGTWYMRL